MPNRLLQKLSVRSFNFLNAYLDNLEHSSIVLYKTGRHFMYIEREIVTQKSVNLFYLDM